MNVEKFDHDVWMLHRKLFHRYIKYEKYFSRATENLPEFQQALEDEAKVRSPKAKAKKTVSRKRKGPQHVSVMDVVSSSSDEVSADDSQDEDE